LFKEFVLTMTRGW